MPDATGSWPSRLTDLDAALHDWRAAHPDATLTELEAAVDAQLQAVRAALVTDLALLARTHAYLASRRTSRDDRAMTWRSRRAASQLVLLVGLLLPLLTFAAPSPALAATRCNETIEDDTIWGSLTVGAGEVCRLNGATVIGSIFVEPGGDLRIINGSTIHGRVEATGHGDLVIHDSVVHGSVIATGGGQEGGVYIETSSIGGRLTAVDNDQFDVLVAASEIRGSATIDDNNVVFVFRVEGNTIGGSLRCSGNSGFNFHVGNNTTVLGQIIGDCT